MASTIRIKRSATSGNPTTLAYGELAYSSLADNGSNGGDRLYIGTGTETNGDAANHQVIGGKYFVDRVGTHDAGTLTANSTLIVDANLKIDVINIDNITVDGNTISSTDTNGDLTLSPNGTGNISADGSRIINIATPTGDSDAATKGYVDDKIDSAQSDQDLTYAIDVGSGGNVTLNADTIKFEGTTGNIQTTARTSNDSDVIVFNLVSTDVNPGTYGTATAIPSFTVDSSGRLTAASTNSIASTINLAGETGTGSVSLLDSSLTITGTDPVQTSASGTTITVSVDDATTTAKGIANFADSNFTVNSGRVTTKGITIGSTAINAGDTAVTTIDGLIQINIGNIRFENNVFSTTDSNASIMTLDPGNNNGTTGKVVVRGDFQVDGTQTVINSSTLTVDDLNITLADGAADSAAANGAGITIDGANSTILYNSTEDRMDFNKDVNVASGKTFMVNGTELAEYIDDQVNTLVVMGEGLDKVYDDGAGTLTLSGEDATVTNKGIASFDSDQFTLTAGNASLTSLDGGTY